MCILHINSMYVISEFAYAAMSRLCVICIYAALDHTGFDTGFFARGGNRIFEEILDIFRQQNRRIQL